jgi:hypothetical protein
MIELNAARGPRPPRLLASGILLTSMVMSLRVLGLRRTLRVARWLGRERKRGGRSTGTRRTLAELVRLSAARVATAAAFYPGRAECLEQSLTLFVLLRRRGLAAELRLGVQTFPFRAHAWVEYGGRPINEHEDFVSRLAAFQSLGG